MKIASLPQVLFDEFPKDDTTKLCILTRPHYPIPDLSQYVGKLLLYCTETAMRFLGSFPKKMPMSLFRLLPEDEQNKKKWEIVDQSSIDGLNTRFAITCIPTGSVIESVMLLLYTIDKPDNLSLYTGMFDQSRQLLLSNTVWKYKAKISDVYFDNTMAGSYHSGFANKQASEDIKKVIDDHPGYTIHLQMEPFESLDLVVELAIQHLLNVKLSEVQQIFLHKSRYQHLFDFDAQLMQLLGKAKNPNKRFQLKNRPRIHIKTVKTFDLATYKRWYDEHKIINIKLISSGNQRLLNANYDGLVYISHYSHAGAYTLANIFNTINPKRVHPIIQDENMNIPQTILNEGCEVINAIGEDANRDFTLEDLSSVRRKSRSFLDLSTNLSSALSQVLSVHNEDNAEGESLTNKSVDQQSNDTQSECMLVPAESSEDVITIDSDSDASSVFDSRKNKRPSSSPAPATQRPKVRKPNQDNNGEENSEVNGRLSRNEADFDESWVSHQVCAIMNRR